MNKCKIRGCRNLEWICKDCGRVVNTATLPITEWINFKDQKPSDNEYIAEIRHRYPAFCWIGKYKQINCEEEDEPDYWLRLPEPPKE